jgi:hypothetical protein
MVVAWVSGYDFSGQISEAEMKEFPHLLKWIERIAAVSSSDPQFNELVANNLSALLFRREPRSRGRIGEAGSESLGIRLKPFQEAKMNSFHKFSINGPITKQ